MADSMPQRKENEVLDLMLSFRPCSPVRMDAMATLKSKYMQFVHSTHAEYQIVFVEEPLAYLETTYEQRAR